MATANKPPRHVARIRRDRKLRESESRELGSMESYRGSRLTVGDLSERECPHDPEHAFRTARTWRRDNWFVGAILGMKANFVRFNQTFSTPDKKKKAALKTWLDQESENGRGTNRMIVERYVQTSVDEFLLGDSLVSFWRENEAPYPLESERCKYSDAMGREVMKVRLGYNSAQLKEAGFSAKLIARYSDGWLTLDEAFDENFRVLTRGMVGNGFGYPRMAQVFRTCSQNESMEVGESLYAYVGRVVERAHSLGWEVRTKDVGVRQTDAMWDAKRAKEIEKYWKGMQGGVAETTRNFDQKDSINWIDPKLFDAKKWETIVSRLQWWGGPLAFMLISRNLNPNFMPVLKAEIKELRAMLKPHLEHVLNKSLTIPGGISIEWTDECFADMRLLWDMVKTLVQQGPASLTTAQRFAGLDPETEADQKLAEANDAEKDKKFMPLFDAQHGNRPGKANNGGRTPGIGDGQGKL